MSERPLQASAARRRAAAGQRVVAVFEAAKGVLVLVVGFGLLELLHENAQNAAEKIVERFHLNLARRHPRVLIDALTHLDNAELRALALAALLYSAVRFVEAYGLWRGRGWAEWFAIVSGGIYLPVEIWELAVHPTVVKAAVLSVNAIVVAYLLRLRWRRREEARAAA